MAAALAPKFTSARRLVAALELYPGGNIHSGRAKCAKRAAKENPLAQFFRPLLGSATKTGCR